MRTRVQLLLAKKQVYSDTLKGTCKQRGIPYQIKENQTVQRFEISYAFWNLRQRIFLQVEPCESLKTANFSWNGREGIALSLDQTQQTSETDFRGNFSDLIIKDVHNQTRVIKQNRT